MPQAAILLICMGCLALGCGASSHVERRSRSPDEDGAEAVRVVRPRPPLAARNCRGLSSDEIEYARDYLSKVTRFELLAHEDAIDAVQQRDIVDQPGRAVGVILYLPAERGMNRAYLERLLYCHAVTPPYLGEHPNDPLLAPGIVSVEITEAPGGQYQIRIRGEDREDAIGIFERAEAATQSSGSVRVRQLDAAPNSP